MLLNKLESQIFLFFFYHVCICAAIWRNKRWWWLWTHWVMSHIVTDRMTTNSWLSIWRWWRLCLWHGRRHCRYIYRLMCRHLLTRVHAMLWWWTTSWLVHARCCTVRLVTARHQCLVLATVRWLNCWCIATLKLGISLSILLYFLVVRCLKSYKVPNIDTDVTQQQ